MIRFYFSFIFSVALYAFGLAQPTFVVDRITDNNTISGEGLANRGDLRYCLSLASLNMQSQIEFEVDDEIFLNNSLPGIVNAVTIDAKQRDIQIDGQLTFRIFTVSQSGSLDLKKLILKHGFAAYASDGGGSILNFGVFRMDSCKILNNLSEGDAGAIANKPNASAQMHNSFLYGNIAGGFGGGIYNLGSLSVSGCVFEKDSSSTADGAISDDGNAIIKQSAFLYNSAFTGASAYGIGNLSGVHQIENCVFYENGSYESPLVPTIRNRASLKIINSSIYSSIGSGILCESVMGIPCTLFAINSIIAIEGKDNVCLNGSVSGSSFNTIFCGIGANKIPNGVNGNITNIQKPENIFQLPKDDYYALGLGLAPYSKAIDGGITSISGFSIPIFDIKDSLRDALPDMGAVEYRKLSPTFGLNFGKQLVYTSNLIPINAITNVETALKIAVTGSAVLINQSNLSLTGIGVITIIGNVAENRFFNAGSISIEVEIIKADQTISGLGQLKDLAFKGKAILVPLPPLSSANLIVDYQFSLDPLNGVVSIVGQNLVIVGSGTISIDAIQSGNEFYNEFQQNIIINVSDSVQTSTFDKEFNDENSTIIFPIPSSGEFNLQTSGKAKVLIYNILGEEIMRKDVINSTSFNLNAKGVYIIKIVSVNGIIFRKILVE